MVRNREWKLPDVLASLMTVEELDFYDEIQCDDLFAGTDPGERIMIFYTNF